MNPDDGGDPNAMGAASPAPTSARATARTDTRLSFNFALPPRRTALCSSSASMLSSEDSGKTCQPFGRLPGVFVAPNLIAVRLSRKSIIPVKDVYPKTFQALKARGESATASHDNGRVHTATGRRSQHFLR